MSRRRRHKPQSNYLQGDTLQHCLDWLDLQSLATAALCNKQLYSATAVRLRKVKLAYLVQERQCTTRPRSVYTNDVVLDSLQCATAARLFFGNYMHNYGWSADDTWLCIIWLPDTDCSPPTQLRYISYHDLFVFYVQYTDTEHDVVATQHNYRVDGFHQHGHYPLYFSAREARVRQLKKVERISIWRMKNGNDGTA